MNRTRLSLAVILLLTILAGAWPAAAQKPPIKIGFLAPVTGGAAAVGKDMTNGFEITHGGLVFALADTTFAICCNEDASVTVAAGADITFLKPTRAGQVLTADARRRSRSGRTGVYDVTITDETGDVVAEFRGRSLTTRDTLT